MYNSGPTKVSLRMFKTYVSTSYDHLKESLGRVHKNYRHLQCKHSFGTMDCTEWLEGGKSSVSTRATKKKKRKGGFLLISSLPNGMAG